MHALRHVHGLVVPDGALVDVHPVTEERVETQTGVIGVIEEPEWTTVELPNAEAALRQTVREGRTRSRPRASTTCSRTSTRAPS